MKKKIVRMAGAVAVGLVLLFGGIWLLARAVGDHDTLYQGKTADYWREQISSTVAAVSNQANAVLVSEIIPGLTHTMFWDTNDSKLRLALVEKLNGLPGLTVYFEAADGRRALAARGLGEFGPAAKPAIPALLKAVRGPDDAVRGPAMGALGMIRSEPDTIIPMLMDYLDDKDLNDEAATALGYFGSQAKVAVPKLIPLLKIPNKDLHHDVVDALRKIDPAAAASAGIR